MVQVSGRNTVAVAQDAGECLFTSETIGEDGRHHVDCSLLSFNGKARRFCDNAIRLGCIGEKYHPALGTG